VRVVPRTNRIPGTTINGVVVTIDWGSGGGTNVSTKFHDPLVVDGMDGNVTTKETRSTGAMVTKSGSNEFVSRGFKGGINPLVKKSSRKLESLVVQIDSV